MTDLVNALETAGLKAIGQGTTFLSILDGVKQALKVTFQKATGKTKKVTKLLFPGKIPGFRTQETSSKNEATEDLWPFLPPLTSGLKTKFGLYLDNIAKNHPPDSEVFFDDKLNVYIRDNKNPKKFTKYRSDFVEFSGVPDEFEVIDPETTTYIADKVKKVSPTEFQIEVANENIDIKLRRAQNILNRGKRALERDVERTYTGKKVLMDDNIDVLGTRTIKDTLNDLRTSRQKLNFDAFQLLNDAVQYDNWVHNTGPQSIIGYEIQDIDNQIKAINALSNSEIRKIAVNVINKAIKGEDLTFTDLYRDLQKISGIGPINLDQDLARYYRGGNEVQDLSEYYDDIISEITNYAPSTGKIFADQAIKLGATAALGSMLKYIPKVGGFISGAVNVVGGSAGLIGLSSSMLLACCGACFKFINSRRITEETKQEDVKDLSSALKEIRDEFADMRIQQKAHDKELIKKVRESLRNEEITRKEADLATIRIERDLALNKHSKRILEETQKKLSKKMSSQLPYIEETPEKIILHYTRSGRSGKKWTTLTASKKASRAGIELDKENYKKSFMGLAKAARAHGSSNDTRIAFIEKTIGHEVPIIDTDVQVQTIPVAPQSSGISAFVSDVGTSALKSAAASIAADRIFNFADHFVPKNFVPLNNFPPPPPPPYKRRKRESHVKIEPVDDIEEILEDSHRQGLNNYGMSYLIPGPGIEPTLVLGNNESEDINIDVQENFNPSGFIKDGVFAFDESLLFFYFFS